MNGDSGNNNAQGSPGSRRPSSGSSISSLNPEAAAFNYRQPESPRYPVGPSNHNRGVRGNSRGQPGTFPLPHIPPRPGRQGHHQQPPPMMQGGGGSAPFQSTPIFGPGPGYQPMFPTSQAPQVPIFCGLPPMPPPGYPQQYPGHGGEHPSSHQDAVDFAGGRSKAIRQRVASISEEPRDRTDSQSPQGQPVIMTEKMIKDKYVEEFEAARGFEDTHIYCPKLFPESKN